MDRSTFVNSEQTGAPPEKMIVCDAVTKRFGEETRPAVDDVSFQVSAGRLVVLLGPSGCGKTTLLKMINRLYEPTCGRILINGVDIKTLRGTTLRRRIGYVIQQVGLFPHMTVEENIAVVPRLLGWSADRIHDRTRFLLEMVGLPETYRKRHPRQISGGEQQRVGLARALAADPAILLMDEPFAAIDAITRERLQDELIDIHTKVKKTILFVTHDVEEAFKLADKILVMREGRLVQSGTPLELVTRPKDAFVNELVGAGNILRKLSLMEVEDVMNVRPRGGEQTGPIDQKNDPESEIHPTDNLREVLSRLLVSGNAELRVVNEAHEEIGRITFDDLRAALTRSAPPVSGRG